MLRSLVRKRALQSRSSLFKSTSTIRCIDRNIRTEHPTCIPCSGPAHQRRHKSVFVSKHNQSLNISASDILSVASTSPTAQAEHRLTSTHVLLQECPFCEKPTDGKPDNQYKMYITLGGGAYFCHRCGKGGSWFDFKRKLGKGPEKSTRKFEEQTAPLPMPQPRLQAVYNSQLFSSPNDNESVSVLEYLQNVRGLDKRTLSVYGVGQHAYTFRNKQNEFVKSECVTFPWMMTAAQVEQQESLRGAKCKPDSDAYVCRRIKVRSVENKAWQRLDPPGGGMGFFGLHTVPEDATEVIITEGEYDAMAVFQATGRPAISLPNGCRSLPVEILALLEDFQKIYLWMDNDAPGQEGAEKFAKKIGVGRTFLVRPTQQNCDLAEILPKDANDALLSGHDMNRIIDDAKLMPHESVLTFSDFEAEVMHEILYPEKYVGLPMTSLPSYTNKIKGLRRGELTVLTGPTGSGKTTFLGQMSLDLAEQGINVLWGSFEIRNTRLAHKLLQQYAREPLPTGDKAMEGKLQAIAEKFKELPMNFLKFHGGTDVDEVIEAMEYAVYVHDTQHIVLDNLQFMISRQDTSKNSFDKFDAQDVAIEKFRQFATDRNVHISLVVHPRKEDESVRLGISSIYGSAKATQEADTVLILQNQNGQKFLDIRKNRFNGELGPVQIFFDKNSCRYAESQNFAPALNRPKAPTAKAAAGGLDKSMDSIFMDLDG